MKTAYGKGLSIGMLFQPPTRRLIGFVASPSEPRLEGDGRSYAIGCEQPEPSRMEGGGEALYTMATVSTPVYIY